MPDSDSTGCAVSDVEDEQRDIGKGKGKGNRNGGDSGV